MDTIQSESSDHQVNPDGFILSVKDDKDGKPQQASPTDSPASDKIDTYDESEKAIISDPSISTKADTYVEPETAVSPVDVQQQQDFVVLSIPSKRDTEDQQQQVNLTNSTTQTESNAIDEKKKQNVDNSIMAMKPDTNGEPDKTSLTNSKQSAEGNQDDEHKQQGFVDLPISSKRHTDDQQQQQVNPTNSTTQTESNVSNATEKQNVDNSITAMEPDTNNEPHKTSLTNSKQSAEGNQDDEHKQQGFVDLPISSKRHTDDQQQQQVNPTNSTTQTESNASNATEKQNVDNVIIPIEPNTNNEPDKTSLTNSKQSAEENQDDEHKQQGFVDLPISSQRDTDDQDQKANSTNLSTPTVKNIDIEPENSECVDMTLITETNTNDKAETANSVSGTVSTQTNKTDKREQAKPVSVSSFEEMDTNSQGQKSKRTDSDDKQEKLVLVHSHTSFQNNTDNAGHIQTTDASSQQLEKINYTSNRSKQETEIDPNIAKKRQGHPVSSELESSSLTNSRPHSPRNQNGASRLWFVPLSVVVMLIALVIVRYNFFPSPETCNMNRADNRDFNKYYGIANIKNHFIISSADTCDSDIIFKPALPRTILKSDHSPSSFLILSPHGTGKTALRCEYFKYLTSDTYFKVLILNKEINQYLERFVKEEQITGTDCQKENCLMKWSENEFSQLLLSLLVTQLVNTFDKEQFHLPNISLNEKIKLVTIICYYFNEEGVKKLERFVNSFLNKVDELRYSASKAELQIKQRHFYVDKPLLTHLRNDLKKLTTLRHDEEKLYLLLAIAEGEDFQYQAMETIKSDNVFNDLRYFALFMKDYLQRTVVFIIDGIDENRFLFQENKVNKPLIELFYRSSISEEIMLGITSMNFYLSLFYPKIDGVDTQQTALQKDKFSIYSMGWNKELLINYADYILEEMNKNASENRCKSLMDFKTLVNYDDRKNAEIINQISTPRVLHYFMQNLIVEMNGCANDVSRPFIATFENIQTAYQNSYKSFYRHDSGAE